MPRYRVEMLVRPGPGDRARRSANRTTVVVEVEAELRSLAVGQAIRALSGVIVAGRTLDLVAIREVPQEVLA